MLCDPLNRASCLVSFEAAHVSHYLTVIVITARNQPLIFANILFAMHIDQAPNRNATNGSSSGLTLNLSSNNPFRNRATSPNNLASSPLRSPFDDPPPRPTSRNPFLDPSFSSSTSNLVASPEKMVQTQRKGARSPTAEELFVSSQLGRNHCGEYG